MENASTPFTGSKYAVNYLKMLNILNCSASLFQKQINLNKYKNQGQTLKKILS